LDPCPTVSGVVGITGYRGESAFFVLLVLASVAAGCAHGTPAAGGDSCGAASVQAAFGQRSYGPGQIAILHLRGRATSINVRFYRAGAGHVGPLQGLPVSASRTLRQPAQQIALTLGDWPSGLYYARVRTRATANWYAPFVMRPSRLGAHRVLVVMPTNTWQAYNFEDGDSWYENSSVHTIDLERPYIDCGVPPHYRGYDRGFLRWLTLHRHEPDFVADDDIDRIARADELARAYDLIVFPGHEEYVTPHEYDVIQRYRDLGGNLAFLSANDFFYKVIKHANDMDGRWRWRDLGRPEAELVGAQYVDWNHDRYPNQPFLITGVGNAPWLFRGTGFRDGDRFGKYGIEVDARTDASPPTTRVLARIPNIFGAGKTAEMTFYTTKDGAKVFSAGVMNFGGSALWPGVRTMIENLWVELARR
jgi:hypothetical protein